MAHAFSGYTRMRSMNFVSYHYNETGTEFPEFEYIVQGSYVLELRWEPSDEMNAACAYYRNVIDSQNAKYKVAVYVDDNVNVLSQTRKMYDVRVVAVQEAFASGCAAAQYLADFNYGASGQPQHGQTLAHEGVGVFYTGWQSERKCDATRAYDTQSNDYATCPADPYVFDIPDGSLTDVRDVTGDQRMPYRADLPFRGGGFTGYRGRSEAKAYTNAGQVSHLFKHCDLSSNAQVTSCNDVGNIDFSTVNIRADGIYPPSNGYLFVNSLRATCVTIDTTTNYLIESSDYRYVRGDADDRHVRNCLKFILNIDEALEVAESVTVGTSELIGSCVGVDTTAVCGIDHDVRRKNSNRLRLMNCHDPNVLVRFSVTDASNTDDAFFENINPFIDINDLKTR
ncbi:hypothetical protein CYMTET_32002 [Cymbomonas tetramitiformis]|uniref:Uncharacterized protein n=1 Tax=Cymbomonas tetramitiformis TaxID=36881 RepID=A0AAE0KSN5_9CHLO|nr:hypothetical protein CYMTET_32002 [Cymbomonas tetramitiformis]